MPPKALSSSEASFLLNFPHYIKHSVCFLHAFEILEKSTIYPRFCLSKDEKMTTKVRGTAR
jgi:hypothetical protein